MDEASIDNTKWPGTKPWNSWCDASLCYKQNRSRVLAVFWRWRNLLLLYARI